MLRKYPDETDFGDLKLVAQKCISNAFLGANLDKLRGDTPNAISGSQYLAQS